MSPPTTATAAIDIAAPPEIAYDLIADVTRMGDWSPECFRCEWLGEPGRVGSHFRGWNRSGPFRWATVACVLVAERPNEFAFATLHRGREATRWTYRFEGRVGITVVSERFEAVTTPLLIGLAERCLIRNRQSQLESGMAATLQAVKIAAEHARRAVPLL